MSAFYQNYSSEPFILQPDAQPTAAYPGTEVIAGWFMDVPMDLNFKSPEPHCVRRHRELGGGWSI